MTDLEIKVLQAAGRFHDEAGEDACFGHKYIEVETDARPALLRKAVKKLRESGYLISYCGVVDADWNPVRGMVHALTPEGRDWLLKRRAK